MLFDPRPKNSRRDLFDREEELEKLDSIAGRCAPLVLVLGIRRIGKTSLLKSFLEEWTGVYVDLRGVRRVSELYGRVSDGLTDYIYKIKNILKNIRGVKITHEGVSIKWKGSDSISLIGLLDEINRKSKECNIIILDEAQSLRPPVSTEVKKAIAYAYDNFEHIMIILSGSEIGLLHDFLGIYNESSPLYGRYPLEIMLERFTREQSSEFLVRGFREEGIEPSPNIVRDGIEYFDGIVGWLVFYGRSIIDYKATNIEGILEKAVDIAFQELAHLSRRERLVLAAIASGADSWSKVRSFIADATGIVLPKSSLSRTIRRLEKLSIIRDYRFLDPVYERAARKL